jgi:hypothetical protein
MGRAVVLTLQPVVKGKLQALEVLDRLRLLQPKKLFSGGTEKPFNLAAASGLVGPGVHQDDTQSIEDPAGLGADKGGSVVGKMPNSAFCRLSRKKTNAEVHEYLPSG